MSFYLCNKLRTHIPRKVYHSKVILFVHQHHQFNNRTFFLTNHNLTILRFVLKRKKRFKPTGILLYHLQSCIEILFFLPHQK